MNQLALDWTRVVDAPVSGSTPAARAASASGAVVGQAIRGRVTRAILAAFVAHGRLTIAECSAVTGIKSNSVCSVWNRLESIGWLVGTGEFQTREVFGRTVKGELHCLTDRGRQAATRP